MKLIVATKNGKVVRVDPSEIPVTQRGRKGFILIRLREGDEVASVVMEKEEEV